MSTDAPQPKGLGDAIHVVALPIAQALHLDCVDPATRKLKPDSVCAKRMALANAISEHKRNGTLGQYLMEQFKAAPKPPQNPS